MTSQKRPSPDIRPERRAHPRISVEAVPYLQARITGAPRVSIIDLSKRGVHIATTMHMRPGRTVIIRFLSGDASMSMTSAVVRSSVAVLEASGDVTYHTALAFTDELTLCSAEFGDAQASLAGEPGVTPVAGPDDYTMLVLDSRIDTPEYAAAGDAR
ncbi:MAG TPA: hypothetical protein VMF13_10140 [Luteitalea sp.]|nr:hypothetical protein [Luteitalea sp.]